jgi:hypothetical protein
MKEIPKLAKIRAIKHSIIHWRENVDKIIECDIYEASHGWRRGTCSVGGENCALCRLIEFYGLLCYDCPLSLNGYRCSENGSPYDKFIDAGTKETALVWAKNMVKVLQEVLEKELKK